MNGWIHTHCLHILQDSTAKTIKVRKQTFCFSFLNKTYCHQDTTSFQKDVIFPLNFLFLCPCPVFSPGSDKLLNRAVSGIITLAHKESPCPTELSFAQDFKNRCQITGSSSEVFAFLYSKKH